MGKHLNGYCHADKRDSDMTRRVLRWCGQYLTPVGIDEDNYVANGADLVAYLEARLLREEYFVGAPTKVFEVEDGFEDFEDFPLDKTI
jgi:hypothetical protein